MVEPLPEGKTAPGGHEMNVDYWELIGSAPSGGAEALLNVESHPDVLLGKTSIEKSFKTDISLKGTLRNFKKIIP